MAPGMIFTKMIALIFYYQDLQKELEPMFQFEAKPKLAAMLNDGGIIASHVMRFYGIGEACFEVQVQNILDAQTNPTVAPLASDGEVTLRVTAKAATEQQAGQLIKAKVAEIQAFVGDYQYGVDDDSLPQKR